MSDFVLSLIRTYVPMAVGAVVAFLATRQVQVDSSISGALVVGLTGLCQAVYYGVVRALETKFPKVGVFLGRAAKPVYVEV